MSVPAGVEDAKTWSEFVVAIGAALVAVAYGLRRVYKMAKNVDELVKIINENNQLAKSASHALATVQVDVGELKTTVTALKTRVDVVQKWQDHENTRREIVKELAQDDTITENAV